MARISALLDHLVYATPALEETIDAIAAAFGVTPLAGGVHPAWGTRNAILPLSARTYLELIGPDPSRAADIQPEIFGLRTLTVPRLVTWAAKGIKLSSLVTTALTHGLKLGVPLPGSRQRLDGSLITWELTDPLQVIEAGLVPFFIDWGATPHPAAAAIPDVSLQEFHAEHPDPDDFALRVRSLDLDLTVEPGPRPQLVATFLTPRGLVTLR
jgi:Glyoxalase-like domain